MSSQRLIKRYSNRKLYDTVDKQYVTLEHIAELIKAGRRVQVIDLSSDEDITNQMLTQVILEQGKKGTEAIPSSVLHNVIRWGGSVIDKSLDQISNGVESLVHDSLTRFLPDDGDDVQRLRDKVIALEERVEELSSQQQEEEN